jgi:nucleoid DNA-binding protein
LVNFLLKKNNNSNLNKAEINEIVNLIFTFFHYGLDTQHVIEVRSFGKFSVKIIPAHRQAWNINKGRKLLNNKSQEFFKYIPEIKSVNFKPSITLKNLLNKKGKYKMKI